MGAVLAMSFGGSASRSLREYEDDFSFQPKLNARSIAMEQARVERGEVTGQNRGEYLHHKDFEIKNRQERMRQRIVEQELEECTFSPAINRGGSNRNHVSIVKNAQLWNERRDEWRHQAAEQQMRKELTECTFQPNLHRDQYFASIPPPAPQDKAIGYDDFVQRQRAGRKKRDEDKLSHEAPAPKVETWTRATTKPQPFKFEHPVKVKALERPAKAAEVVAKAERPSCGQIGVTRMYEEYDQDYEASAALRPARERVEEFLSKYNPESVERMSRSISGLEDSDIMDHSAEGAEDRYYKRMEEARRKQALKREALKNLSGGPQQRRDDWTTTQTGQWKGRQTLVQEFQWDKPVVTPSSLRKPVPMMVVDW